VDKVFDSAAAAVADVPDGASVSIAGFGITHRFPATLIAALRDHGASGLTVYCNGLGQPGQPTAQMLAENRQIARLVASFSARPGGATSAETQIADGEMGLELVPQGTLVERMRAGGAGIPAFFTPAGAGASRNFNDSFAKAARVAIIEVEEIVDTGLLTPEEIDLPGVFISRVVQTTIHVDPATMPRRGGRGADTRRSYAGKPALTRAEIGHRVAALLQPGQVVNLCAGLPTQAANFLQGKGVVLHGENGVLNYGTFRTDGPPDPDLHDAGGNFITLNSGASFFDSVTSFEIARSGRLDAVVLGAYQVGANGDLANYAHPGMTGGGIGGAMDLAVGARQVIAMLEHSDSQGRPKLVARCDYPLTTPRCVDVIVTDVALLRRDDGGFRLDEIAAGFTVDEVLALTGMPVRVADQVGVLQESW
jgi:3-oxoacid CoA-transferase